VIDLSSMYFYVITKKILLYDIHIKEQI